MFPSVVSFLLFVTQVHPCPSLLLPSSPLSRPSGLSGQPLQSFVFTGPVYYQKLKHMVRAEGRMRSCVCMYAKMMMCACVCACVRACRRAGVCACVRTCVCVRAYLCENWSSGPPLGCSDCTLLLWCCYYCCTSLLQQRDPFPSPFSPLPLPRPRPCPPPR